MMTQLEISLCASMCKALETLSEFDRGRLLGYGEGLAKSSFPLKVYVDKSECVYI